jgi:hypothetical protein
MLSPDEKHPNSKVITIFRAGSYLSRVQGKDIEDYFADSKVSIGSFYESENNPTIATGLSFPEQKLLLPTFVDEEADGRDFRKKVSAYYADLDIKLPFKGLQLEIGLEVDNNGAVTEKNMPLDISDYIKYRLARKHPHMAPSKESADANPIYQYYIFDKEAVVAKNANKTKELDDAMKLFFKIENDPQQIRQFLSLSGKDPREYPAKDRDTLLKAALRDIVTQKPARFIELFGQEDIEIRYWITAMIRTKVLTQLGERIQVTNSKPAKLIGKNLEEAIAYFLDEENEDYIAGLKALQQEEEKALPSSAPLKTRKLNEV